MSQQFSPEITKAFTNRTGALVQAAITDLEKSGILPATAIRAGVKVFRDRAEDLKRNLGFASIDGQEILRSVDLIEFPYYNEDGSVEFSRYKPIPQIDAHRKYLHPLKAPPIPYILPEVWAVKEKHNVPIWITEGEKKALKIIQSGRAAVALPGIWGFKAGKNSSFEDGSKYLWKQLRGFEWSGRSVFLAFDSDLWTNPQVRYALYELAVKLISLGAVVKFADWREGKGIDDYLVTTTTPEKAILALEDAAKDISQFVDPAHSKEVTRAISVSDLSPLALDQITRSLAKVIGVSQTTLRQQLKALKGRDKDGVEYFFQRFALIRGTEFVYDCETKKSMRVGALALEFPDLCEMWKRSSAKRVINAEKIVFKPNGCAQDEENLFKGIDFKPRTGSCNLILELLFHLCNDDEKLYHWVLCWLAYPIKHVGAKLRTSIVFHGGQGSGKNLIFQDLMCAIYDEYASYMTQDRLEEKYTDWMSAKLYIVCDEVLANKSQGKMKNLLKSYVTQPVANVRRMYEPYRAEENHANFVFLSNESLPILIESDDRRYLIVRQETPREKDFYRRCAEQVNSPEGRGAFVKFLLEYNTEDFNEHTEPFMTEAKEELQALCEPAPVRFAMLWQSGELDLPYCSCTSANLYDAFLLWMHHANEYGSYGATRFALEIGRLIDRGKLQRIRKAKPYVYEEGRNKQVRGYEIDLSQGTKEVWFVGNVFDPSVVDQIGRFSAAVDSFRKKVEATRLR